MPDKPFDPDVSCRQSALYWAAALAMAVRDHDAARADLAKANLVRLGYRADIERMERKEVAMTASNPALQPLLVSEREAARLLGVCAKTIFNLRKRGLLRGVPIGARVMYAVRDLEAFIERQKGGTNVAG